MYLIIVIGNLNTLRYRDYILVHVVNRNVIFKQDNARQHTA